MIYSYIRVSVYSCVCRCVRVCLFLCRDVCRCEPIHPSTALPLILQQRSIPYHNTRPTTSHNTRACIPILWGQPKCATMVRHWSVTTDWTRVFFSPERKKLGLTLTGSQTTLPHRYIRRGRRDGACSRSRLSISACTNTTRGRSKQIASVTNLLRDAWHVPPWPLRPSVVMVAGRLAEHALSTFLSIVS
jgi:hypothetical protein